MSMDTWWIELSLIYNNPVVAKLYDFFAWPFSTMAAIKMADALQDLPEGSEVLDIGTGTGMVATRLARSLSKVKVTGVDPSRQMLEVAERRVEREGLTNVTLIADHAQSLPVGAKRFDAVVCSQIFRCIKPESVATVMGEIRRVIKPKGRLLIADIHLPLTGAFPQGIGRDNLNYFILGALAIYDPPSLARYAENYGFTFERLSYYPLSFMLVLRA